MPIPPSSPLPSPSSYPYLRTRPLLLAISIVAIVATGSYAGASLKPSQAAPQTPAAPSSTDAQLQTLSHRRQIWAAKKAGLELKIAELQARQVEKAQRAQGRGSAT
ncbi:MAG: hypothetical protein HETSPECPRED_000966 [Heterodermia speciosa]|uniref:Uncharacterized protein n=1 Tax=Heterodermia speciosa TaxID=116794 RepID=A0A8H3EVR8_9LECA|nr:MAG: hypothetical protein HETSPECPRED_000966 [Heterodermia speciosa]